MKKLLTLAVLITLSLTPLFALSGEVISISGKVEIETNSGWKTLKEGETVDLGKVISTGFRSKAVIKIGESLVTVNPLSRLTLEELRASGDMDETKVFLDLGTISADVKKTENKRVGFEINTPVATASVRGTSFTVGVNYLNVDRGLIAYSAKGSIEVPVAKGASSTVSLNGNVIKPASVKIATGLGETATEEAPVSIASKMADAVATSEPEEAKSATISITIMDN